jgi:hypothetical protein
MGLVSPNDRGMREQLRNRSTQTEKNSKFWIFLLRFSVLEASWYIEGSFLSNIAESQSPTPLQLNLEDKPLDSN